MQPLSGEERVACRLAELIRPKALYEGVADSIRERILAHQLPPGSPIDEAALARHYGVSRTPVREAIKVLANEGLLCMTPYQGCCVAEVGREDLLELLDVIELLDSHALLQIAMQPEKNRLIGLFDAYEQMAAASSGQGAAAWTSFCCLLREGLGSTPFAAVSRNLHQQLRLCLGPRLEQADYGVVPEQRAALLRALLDGDTAKAGQIGGLHAAAFRTVVLASFDRRSECRVGMGEVL